MNNETATAEHLLRAFEAEAPRNWGSAVPQLWLGESGIELNGHPEPKTPDGGDHVPGLDDGFAGLMVWVDKLGLAFRNGHTAVAQQQVPHYLIQAANPPGNKNASEGVFAYAEPSVYGLLAFKRILGGGASVLSADSESKYVRAYAFRRRETRIGIGGNSTAATPAGLGVVVMAINLQPNGAAVELVAQGSFEQTSIGRMESVGRRRASPVGRQWVLQPHPGTDNVTAAGV